jgi:uncharacterized protein (TIGR00369 family)
MADPNLSRTLDELSSYCFGCGTDNPEGLHLTFTLSGPDEPLKATSDLFSLTKLHQGPPGYVHGGIIATLLDEVMSKLNRPLGVIAMTRTLSVDYRRPVPLHTPLRLVATPIRIEGRKHFHSGQVQLEDGTLLASGEALWIAIDKSKFITPDKGE